MVKNLPANVGDIDSIPGQEDPLEEEMATHSSILAWRIPGTEEPGGLQSMGSQRLGSQFIPVICWLIPSLVSQVFVSSLENEEVSEETPSLPSNPQFFKKLAFY